MVDALYTTEKECPICKRQITVTKVRSRLTMVKQDRDFCTYYKEVNPNYYGVWVCNHCGYAAQDTAFGEVPPAAEEKIRKFLASRQVNVNFNGTRTREQAIATYKLAIFYAELINAQHSRLAALYIRLAWLYREGEQGQEEQLALNKAREHYEQALLRERFPIGNMSQITVEYLIGELLRRTGKIDSALSYLGKVVGNPVAKLEKRILDMAKEAWHEAREAKKQMAAANDDGKESEKEQE